MEVGEEGGCYTYRYTVTTRMIPALRWAVMRAEKDSRAACFSRGAG